VKYLLLAGDSTLVALYSYAIQTPVNRFANAAKYYILKLTSRRQNASISLQILKMQVYCATLLAALLYSAES